MSDQEKLYDGSLVPAGRQDLAAIAPVSSHCSSSFYIAPFVT